MFVMNQYTAGHCCPAFFCLPIQHLAAYSIIISIKYDLLFHCCPTKYLNALLCLHDLTPTPVRPVIRAGLSKGEGPEPPASRSFSDMVKF